MAAVAARFGLLGLWQRAAGFYGSHRAIKWERNLTGAVRVGGTIVAGCSLATKWLKMLAAVVVRDVRPRVPSVKLRCLVDDFSAVAWHADARTAEDEVVQA
eukprot:5234381-Amphidinium_carterae.1